MPISGAESPGCGDTCVSIRLLIIDDEPLARRSVRRFLKSDPSVEVIGECGDGQSAVAAIRSSQPDLVFLDVQMPEMDGFEVLGRVGLERLAAVIFVTAYDRYALRAFDSNALDYLLKPFGRERFERALMRAKERIAGKPNLEESRRMLDVLEQVRAQNRYAERLPIAENRRITFVRTPEIDWIEAEGNCARLHTRGREHSVRETLASLQRKLNPRDFLRIHRSAIVNVHRIREIQPWFHGYHLVLLENGNSYG
jgi:two-component system, LytTR family, response regulator